MRVAAQAPTASPVPLIISEFRLRGPNGPSDEFVEIYNNSDSPHTVNSLDGTSSGYALVGSSNAVINDSLVATRFVIPQGTVIRAHLRQQAPGYLNGYPAEEWHSCNRNITAQVDPDNVGLALFGTAVPFNCILAGIDTVGSSTLITTRSSVKAPIRPGFVNRVVSFVDARRLAWVRLGGCRALLLCWPAHLNRRNDYPRTNL